MANKTKHLSDAYQQLRQQDEDCVLATIIETFGSTYQKAGARLLITKSAELIGLLGGGCFEADLIEQAKSVFETGSAKTVFYDMRSPVDVVWGLGLGCNGAVRVALQLLQEEDDFSPLNSIVEAAELGLAGVLVTVYESEHGDFPAGHSSFLPAPNKLDFISTIPDAFTATALKTRWQQIARLETLSVDGYKVSVFCDPILPPSRLLVLGAGADAVPLVNCAHALGWRVTLVDHRPAHINPERFPSADKLINIMPEDIKQNLDLSPFNAAVLMTHNFDYDARFLKAIAGAHIPFIGLLGPTPRKERLLQSLGDEAELIKPHVYGPVGLDIGAQSPEEIALSIMAGIYAALNGRTGQQLSQNTKAEAHDCFYS